MSSAAELPTLVPVTGSSNVLATGHQGQSLYMLFRREGNRTALYRYDGVSESEHRDMRKNPLNGSVGQHFDRFIKRRYHGVKVREE